MPNPTSNNSDKKQGLVTVATVNDYQLALLYQSKLESFGIHSNISGYTPFWGTESGGIKLQVTRSDVTSARKLLGKWHRQKRKIHQKTTLIDKFLRIYNYSKLIFAMSLVIVGVIIGFVPYLVGRLIPAETFTEIDIAFIAEWINGFVLLLFIGMISLVVITTIVFTRKYMFPKEEE